MAVASETAANQAAVKNSVALENDPYTPFNQAMSSEKILAATKVFMEELARLREQSPNSGWRESEALELAVGYLDMIPKHESSWTAV